MTGRYSRCGLAREKPAFRSAPLNRGPHAVPIPEIDVVPHADLIAVVKDRRAGEREERAVHQLDVSAVASEEGRQAPAYPEVHPGLRVDREQPVHVIPVLVTARDGAQGRAVCGAALVDGG